jgi:LacI family transcriptional regulator
MPIVFFDRVVNDFNTHKVIVDNYKGAYEATVELINQGYKNIATIANSANLSITQERLAGYKAALGDHGIPEKESYMRFCAHGGLVLSEVEEVITELLSLKPKPDAILALGDKLTTGALRMLKAKKVNVPADIGLIGFSNSETTELIDPALSIIKQPAFEMGEIATTLLLQLIESKHPVTQFETRVLAPQLILRDSSCKQKEEKKSLV